MKSSVHLSLDHVFGLHALQVSHAGEPHLRWSLQNPRMILLFVVSRNSRHEAGSAWTELKWTEQDRIRSTCTKVNRNISMWTDLLSCGLKLFGLNLHLWLRSAALLCVVAMHSQRKKQIPSCLDCSSLTQLLACLAFILISNKYKMEFSHKWCPTKVPLSLLSSTVPAPPLHLFSPRWSLISCVCGSTHCGHRRCAGTKRERAKLVRRNTICFPVASVEFPPDWFRSLTFYQMFCMMRQNIWIY